MSRHLGGMAAVLGGGLLIMGMVLNSRLQLQGAFVVLAAMAALVVAMAGLSSLQSRHHPVATWAVFGVTAVAMVVWPIFAIAGYFVAQPITEEVWVPHQIAFLVWTAGTAAFAALTYRTGAVSRRAAALLAASATSSLIGQVTAYLPEGMALSLLGVGYLIIPFAWIALGLSALGLAHRSTPAA